MAFGIPVPHGGNIALQLQHTFPEPRILPLETANLHIFLHNELVRMGQLLLQLLVLSLQAVEGVEGVVDARLLGQALQMLFAHLAYYCVDEGLKRVNAFGQVYGARFVLGF